MKIDELQQPGFKPDVPIILSSNFRYHDGVTYVVKTSRQKNLKGEMETVETEIPICSNGALITAIIDNPDNQEVSYEVSFGENKKIPISGGDIFQKKGIMELCKYGLVIADSDAKEMNKFFADFVARNNVCRHAIYERFGWKDNGFLLGEYLYKFDGTVEKVHNLQNSPIKEYIAALTSRGTVAGWMESVEKLMKYNTQRYKMYISATAPILQLIDAGNIVLNDYGRSGKGKTLTTEVPMSIYGDSEKLLQQGGQTLFASEVLATIYSDIPLNLDDMQNTDEETRKKIVYMMGNGSGKARGTKDNTLRDTRRWHNVTLMTSEVPLLVDTSLEGIENRLIEVVNGLGVQDNEAARTFKQNRKNNYGVFAPLLIQRIIARREKLVQEYEQNIKYLDTLHQTSNNKFKDMFAAILTGGQIFEEVYGEIGGEQRDPRTVIAPLYLKQITGRVENSYAIQGLTAIMQWVAANKNFFNFDGSSGAGIQHYKMLGNVTEEFTDIIPTELKKELVKQYDIARLMNDFKEQGVIKYAKNRKEWGARIESGGDRVWVYRFINREVEKFLGGGKESDEGEETYLIVKDASQRERLGQFKELVRSIQIKTGQAVAVEDIQERARDIGMDKETVEDILMKLKSIGEILEASRERYRVV